MRTLVFYFPNSMESMHNLAHSNKNKNDNNSNQRRAVLHSPCVVLCSVMLKQARKLLQHFQCVTKIVTGNDDPGIEDEGQEEQVPMQLEQDLPGNENSKKEASEDPRPNEPNSGLVQLHHPQCWALKQSSYFHQCVLGLCCSM